MSSATWLPIKPQAAPRVAAGEELPRCCSTTTSYKGNESAQHAIDAAYAAEEATPAAGEMTIGTTRKSGPNGIRAHDRPRAPTERG